MKRVLLLMVAVMFTAPIFAQTETVSEKERAAIRKMTKEQVKSKADKTATKEAKKLEKEGWRAPAGDLPIAKQLDRSYNMAYEINENGEPKYIMATTISVGQTQIATKTQAEEAAKQSIASRINSEVAGLVKNMISNNQLNSEEGKSVTETITSSQSLISARLGRIITVVSLYRHLENKNVEVQVRCACNYDEVIKNTLNTVTEELRKDSKELADKLEKILAR